MSWQLTVWHFYQTDKSEFLVEFCKPVKEAGPPLADPLPVIRLRLLLLNFRCVYVKVPPMFCFMCQ